MNWDGFNSEMNRGATYVGCTVWIVLILGLVVLTTMLFTSDIMR